MTARIPNPQKVFFKSREYHGLSRTRLYYIWRDMRRRCYSPKYIGHRYYSEKGIRVCQEWFLSFLSFRSWALETGYANNLTIDRIDNDGNYEPSNCQWLTKSQNVSRAHKVRQHQRRAS